jgi:CheY-like chemotaxis protein
MFERRKPTPAETAAQPRSPAGRIPAIILVEDEPDILLILHRLMRDLTSAYDIITVNGGAEALRQLALRPVPLLITDYNMPEMNGVDLARAVKEVSPDTAVLLISAYGTPELERRVHEAGADYYLTKPFSPDRLEQIVHTTLT